MNKKIINCPIAVIGPPRSGTTFITSILQNDFGVLMCTESVKLREIYDIDEMVYEEFQLTALSYQLSTQIIEYNRWKILMMSYFDRMRSYNRPWGFKDPRLINGLHWVINYFNKDLTIIRCKRLPGLVIKSMIEKLKWSYRHAASVYYRTELMIDQILVNANKKFIQIDFKEKHYDRNKVINFLEMALLNG